MGSMTSRRALSIMDGIIRARSGADSSKQGFVLTSIRKTLKVSSIMKSSPKSYARRKSAFKSSTYLKGIASLEGVNLAPGSPHTVICELLDLREDVAVKANVQVAMVLVQVGLEVAVADLVARFELPVVFALLLDCIVSQVDHSVGQIGQRELSR